MSKKRKNFHYHYAEQYETRRERRRTKRRFSAPPVALLFTLIMLGLFGMISVSFSAFVTNDISDPDKPAKNSLIASVRNHAVRENTDSDLVSRKADLAGVGAYNDISSTGDFSGKYGSVSVYFKNTQNWNDVYVYLYSGNPGSNKGAPKASTNLSYYGQMTEVDTTNHIFAYHLYNCGNNGLSNHVIFSEADQHDYGEFYSTKVAYNTNFSLSTPLYTCPSSAGSGNGCTFYNGGTWSALSASTFSTPNDGDIYSVLNGSKVMFYYGSTTGVVGNNGNYKRIIDDGTEIAYCNTTTKSSDNNKYFAYTCLASKQYYVSYKANWWGLHMDESAVGGTFYYSDRDTSGANPQKIAGTVPTWSTSSASVERGTANSGISATVSTPSVGGTSGVMYFYTTTTSNLGSATFTAIDPSNVASLANGTYYIWAVGYDQNIFVRSTNYATLTVVEPKCRLSASPASLSLKVGEAKSVTISAENHASGNVTVTVPQAARDYIQVCATQNGTYSYSATLTGITNSATKNVYVKGIRPYSNATLTAACQQHTTIPSSTPATFTVSVSTPNLTVSDLTLEEAKSGTLTATVASGSPTPSSYQWSIASGDRITLGSSSTGSVGVTALKLTSNDNATAKVTVTASYSTGYSKTFTNAATVTVTASKYFLNGFGAASGTAGWGYSAWGNAPERRMVYNPSTSKYEVSLNFTGANVKSYPGGSDENGFKIRYNDTWYTGSYSGNSKLTRSVSGTAKSFSTTGGSNNNAGIKIDIAGTYLFAFDPTSGSEKLTVTYPADVTVNYHTNGGTLPTPDYTEETAGALYTGTYPYADGLAAASMPVASYTGYTFDGWYSDAECTASVTSIAASTAVYDLYAKWSISSISIRDNIDGNEIMTISGITMGADITETDITDAADFIAQNTALEARGYEFSSWSPALTNVTSSTIYAQYLPVTKAFDVSILPTNIISGAGTQNNPFVITFGSSIKVQASIIDPLEDNNKISYRWSLTENGTYVAGSTGTTYENDNIIATMPSKTSGYFDLYTKAYANDYNNQQLIGASTQSKRIWYKVESPLGNVTLNSSTDYQKIYKSTPVVDVTFDTNMYQYSSQDLDNTKVNDFTRYKVDFQEYSFDSYASLLENLLSITFANGAFDAPPITGIETVVVGSESVDNITEYGKLSGVHHFKYLLKRPAVPSGYEDDSSIEFRTVVGTNMSNNTRPLYLYNNGSSLAERRVMLFYVKSGSLLHQTAQRVSTTPEIYRFEIPTDADLQIQIAAIDTAKKYELPYYDFANNQIYYYENTNPDIPDTNAHCASKMSDFMSVNTAGSEIQTLYLSSVTFGTDASPGTMTVSTGDYTM